MFVPKLIWVIVRKCYLGSYIISTALKLPPTKLQTSFDLLTLLYKSPIQPYMKYCCRVWAGGPSCYQKLLDKLQKLICWTIGPSLAISLESLAHHQNVVSPFYRSYPGRCSSQLAKRVAFPYSQERFTCYSDRYYKDVFVNSFFPHTARVWNSLPLECFLLTYDLNGFKSGSNRHLLTVGSF